MKKRILFFSCEPGGAEVLIPVVKLLAIGEIYEVVVLAYGHGLDRFRKKGIICTETAPVAKDDITLFNRYSPDFIITSAASLPEKDMSEKHLWNSAKKVGIKTLAFLDQWQNYSARFSGPDVTESLAYLPDFINCINDIGKAEMLAEGFASEKLLSFGHPYLSGISAAYSKIKRESFGYGETIQARNNTLLFVSEAILEHYGNKRGYNQFQALDLLLEKVQSFNKNSDVIIKLHPKDDITKYQSIASKFEELKIRFIRNELNSLECLALTDNVFGMSSIMLIEAFILGKTVVSIQPNLITEDPFILSRYNLIACIKDHLDFDPFDFKAGHPEKLHIHFDKELFARFLLLHVWGF
jgi:hypothetical protein